MPTSKVEPCLAKCPVGVLLSLLLSESQIIRCQHSINNNRRDGPPEERRASPSVQQRLKTKADSIKHCQYSQCQCCANALERQSKLGQGRSVQFKYHLTRTRHLCRAESVPPMPFQSKKQSYDLDRDMIFFSSVLNYNNLMCIKVKIRTTVQT